MKMLKLVCTVIFLQCVLSGCARNKVIEKENPDSLQYIHASYSMTDEVLLSSFNGINYRDFINGTKIYACNRLDCSHQPGSDCMAYPNEKKGEGIFWYPFLYNEKLYYFDVRKKQILLIRSKPDGSEKEVLAEQELSSLEGSSILKIGSKLYYWGSMVEKETDEGGNVEILSMNCEIYEADIDTGIIRQLSSLGTYYSYNIYDLIYSEGHIYFSYSIQQRSWMDTPYANPMDRIGVASAMSAEDFVKLLDMQSMIGRIDISTKEQEIHPVDFLDTIVGVTQDKIFMITANEEELIYSDKSWKDKTILHPADMMNNGNTYNYNWVDGRLIITVWESYEQPAGYFIWDDNKNGFRDLRYHLDYGISFLDVSINNLLIARTPLKASTRSDEWSYILADKQKFFEGELVYTETEVKPNE